MQIHAKQSLANRKVATLRIHSAQELHHNNKKVAVVREARILLHEGAIGQMRDTWNHPCLAASKKTGKIS
jgi:hypothetical protein